jgi:large subunit ribosomal protein L10
LNIEAEQVFNDFAVAHSNAFNLAFNVVYFTKENIPLLVARAFKNAKALAVEASIITQSTVRQIMAKATRQAIALNDLLKENIVEKSENN